VHTEKFPFSELKSFPVFFALLSIFPLFSESFFSQRCSCWVSFGVFDEPLIECWPDLCPFLISFLFSWPGAFLLQPPFQNLVKRGSESCFFLTSVEKKQAPSFFGFIRSFGCRAPLPGIPLPSPQICLPVKGMEMKPFHLREKVGAIFFPPSRLRCSFFSPPCPQNLRRPFSLFLPPERCLPILKTDYHVPWRKSNRPSPVFVPLAAQQTGLLLLVFVLFLNPLPPAPKDHSFERERRRFPCRGNARAGFPPPSLCCAFCALLFRLAPWNVIK